LDSPDDVLEEVLVDAEVETVLDEVVVAVTASLVALA